MESGDKNWAQDYVNGPLTAPDPSDETGLGASFRPPSEKTSASSVTPSSTGSKRLSKNNPYRKDAAEKAYPSPPPSASPRHSPSNSGSHRSEFLGTTRPRRTSSLKERYPGDPSVRPLDQLAKEKATADRSRHITKKHAIRPDTIDSLDNSGLGGYHHEGPYDATLFARNNSFETSPLAAVTASNNEALRATPHDRIIDSVQRHRPLDGTATYAPGTTDREGNTYSYEEGENMMTEENAPGGPYKRWPGVQYHPDDIKGKGEPSYSIEKALKEHTLSEKDGSVEMQSSANEGIGRSRSASGAHRSQAFGSGDSELGRSGSLSNRLRKRVGSLRKKLKDEE